MCVQFRSNEKMNKVFLTKFTPISRASGRKTSLTCSLIVGKLFYHVSPPPISPEYNLWKVLCPLQFLDRVL